MKFVAQVGNGSTPSRENSDYWSDGTYPWLNSSVVNEEDVTKPSELVSRRTLLRECHLPRIEPPAVLVGITGEGKTRAMASTLRIEATINQHLAFIKPFDSGNRVGLLSKGIRSCIMPLVFVARVTGGRSTKGAITV